MSLRERLIAEGVLRPGPAVAQKRTEDGPTPQPWLDVPTMRLDVLARKEAERQARSPWLAPRVATTKGPIE